MAGWRSRLEIARSDVGDRAAGLVDVLRRRRITSTDLGRGVAFAGTVWPGGAAEPFAGVVIVDGHGLVRYLGPMNARVVPADVPLLGGPANWVGPGVVDTHVHLAFSSAAELLRRGVVGVRDLGAPATFARQCRSGHRLPKAGQPFVAVSGPILTAPGGYPSRTWGRDGFSAPVSSAGQARHVVHRLAAAGADVIKIALEPGAEGWPVPPPQVVRAVVIAAHATSLAVVAHALTVEMVGRAADAGVDELAHVPTQRLPDRLVERLAEREITVVSTLQAFFSGGQGRDAAANAAALHRAGVQLRYGTDLGNDGTRPGVDPRELDRLADAGLGRVGALRAATEHAARAAGIRRRTGLLRTGEPAALVLLSADPVCEPGVWRRPLAVLSDGRLHVG